MLSLDDQKAYVLLSGGQDSFVSLLWAKETFRRVEAISIDYGQRHHSELEQAVWIAKEYAVEHTTYCMRDFFKSFQQSALLNETISMQSHYPLTKELPASFVPGRNGMFLTVVATHAFHRESLEKRLHLVIGSCEVDYSGYPDCRYHYIKAKELELSYGLEREVIIHVPLMWSSKTDILHLAEGYGGFGELSLSDGELL